MKLSTAKYVKSPKEINGVKVVNDIAEAIDVLLHKKREEPKLLSFLLKVIS